MSTLFLKKIQGREKGEERRREKGGLIFWIYNVRK